MREAMQWPALEPRFIEIYQASFTQAEVDGMLEFYRSPAGQAVIAKIPGAMQRTMVVMQELMDGMMPRLRELQAQALDRLKATREKVRTAERPPKIGESVMEAADRSACRHCRRNPDARRTVVRLRDQAVPHRY